MLCCAVLCCAVLCCAVLCCAVLCCAVLCYAVLCYAVLCYVMVCYGYGTVRYGTVRYGTVRYGMVWYGVIGIKSWMWHRIVSHVVVINLKFSIIDATMVYVFETHGVVTTRMTAVMDQTRIFAATSHVSLMSSPVEMVIALLGNINAMMIKIVLTVWMRKTALNQLRNHAGNKHWFTKL